ncbi:CPXV166 protein, partial [Monkeypox virus]
KLGSSI